MIQVGQTIGNYTITAKLGEGGMGIVYLAEHPVIGRKVAMKAIHPELSRNPEVISRFMTEAKSVNQIGNEHIVDISDFGNTADGEFYFIMEFLQGEALSDRLRRDRVLAIDRALHIAAQVADALAASHAHGIIHRDLKPENIFLITKAQSPDFVKVLDFGLAKLMQGEEKVTHKTRTGSVMGTPYYMSPEQCEGKANIDHRADIYSLGVILFEMLTGKVPFGGEGYGEIIVKHITQPPPSPRAINPALSPAHEAVLLRALAKPREERYQSMEEFREALLNPDQHAVATSAARRNAPTLPTGGAGRGDPLGEVGAIAAPLPTTFRDGIGEILEEDLRPRRSKKGLVVGGLALAALAAGGAFFMKNRRPDQAPTAGPVSATAAPIARASQPGEAEPVTVSFTSQPAGATVVRKDTGETLGTTPFSRPFPRAREAIEFVFSKPGFEEESVRYAPERAGELPALLKAAAGSPLPTGEPGEGRTVGPGADDEPRDREPREREPKSGPKAAVKPAAKPTKKASSPKPAAKRERPATAPKEPIDEDAPLAPSFLNQ
jgi:serine/threonine-protein kinase